ncbi:MAG: hypothetical protein J6J56_06690 [Rikenellaceae bacterium]|nr:hypothetical protein [Rikenellaceae bacterium]MBP3683295.1 hypothetical protein [Rikenellaceae bacterium]
MKHILTLVLLAMQIAVCAAQPTAPLTNPTAESKVLYIVADSCDFQISIQHTKQKDNSMYQTLIIPTDNGIFAIGCKDSFIERDGKTELAIDKVFPRSDLDKTPTIRMKDFAKGKSAKQLQRAYDRWQEEYDYVFVTKCYNPDNDKQERSLAVDSYIYNPAKVKYPHYPADSLANAIERGARVLIFDSNKPYARIRSNVAPSVTYAHGFYVKITGYDLRDQNGDKVRLNLLTQDNLTSTDEITTYTIDRSEVTLEGEAFFDFSEIAATRNEKEIRELYYKFEKGQEIGKGKHRPIYIIDRAEMTKGKITVHKMIIEFIIVS